LKKESGLDKFIIPRKAFRSESRPNLPMIRWTKRGVEINPALLTPENVKELDDELFGAYADTTEGALPITPQLKNVIIYQFYATTSAIQGSRFRRTPCLRVWWNRGDERLRYVIAPPYLDVQG
jgi:hypothetical protein